MPRRSRFPPYSRFLEWLRLPVFPSRKSLGCDAMPKQTRNFADSLGCQRFVKGLEKASHYDYTGLLGLTGITVSRAIF